MDLCNECIVSSEISESRTRGLRNVTVSIQIYYQLIILFFFFNLNPLRLVLKLKKSKDKKITDEPCILNVIGD